MPESLIEKFKKGIQESSLESVPEYLKESENLSSKRQSEDSKKSENSSQKRDSS